MAARKFKTQLDGLKSRVPVYACSACCFLHMRGKPATCSVCGKTDFVYFGSKTEAKRFPQLRLMQDAGMISKIELQPRFPIAHNGVKIMTVRADFGYWRNKTYIIEDVKAKGAPLTRTFTIGRKLVAAFYGYEIVVVEL